MHIFQHSFTFIATNITLIRKGFSKFNFVTDLIYFINIYFGMPVSFTVIVLKIRQFFSFTPLVFKS